MTRLVQMRFDFDGPMLPHAVKAFYGTGLPYLMIDFFNMLSIDEKQSSTGDLKLLGIHVLCKLASLSTVRLVAVDGMEDAFTAIVTMELDHGPKHVGLASTVSRLFFPLSLANEDCRKFVRNIPGAIVFLFD